MEKSTNGVEKSATEVNDKSANDTKKLTEKVEEAEEESEYEYEDEEEEEDKEDEDLEDLDDLEELEDIDLPDPFSTEPVPKVSESVVFVSTGANIRHSFHRQYIITINNSIIICQNNYIIILEFVKLMCCV